LVESLNAFKILQNSALIENVKLNYRFTSVHRLFTKLRRCGSARRHSGSCSTTSIPLPAISSSPTLCGILSPRHSITLFIGTTNSFLSLRKPRERRIKKIYSKTNRERKNIYYIERERERKRDTHTHPQKHGDTVDICLESQLLVSKEHSLRD